MPSIVSFDEHLALLSVSGDEDRASSGLRRPSLSAALQASRDVVVDLSELRFADSSLILDLAMLAQRLRAHGHGLRVCGSPPHIHRLIRVVGLHSLPAVAVDDPR